MIPRISNVPDFATKLYHKPEKTSRFERLRIFNKSKKDKLINDDGSEVNDAPSLITKTEATTPQRPKTVPYGKTFPITNSQENEEVYYRENTSRNYSSTEQFPNSNLFEGRENKNKTLLEPTLKNYSEYSPNPKRIISNNDNAEDNNKWRKREENILLSNHSANSKSSKKVKWEDGYDASPSSDWYSSKPKQHSRKYRDYYYYPKPGKNYLYTNGSKNHQEFYDFGYQDYDYYDYHQRNYNQRKYNPNGYEIIDYNPNAYPNPIIYNNKSPKNRYNEATSRGRYHYFDYYPSKYYRKHARYGDYENWVYTQSDQETLTPYNYYPFDNGYYDDYLDGEGPGHRSFRNSIAQYDIIDRVQNKKLQVSDFESPRRSNQRMEQVESKKVGNEEETSRITKSNQNLTNNKENACTQITETKSHQTLHISNNQEQNGRNHNTSSSTNIIINKFLLELTSKLKSGQSENLFRSTDRNREPIKRVDRNTQYDKSVFKKHATKQKKFFSTQRKKMSLASLFRTNKTQLKILQNQSTQFEKRPKSLDEEYKITTTTTLERDSLTLCEKFFKKRKPRNNKDIETRKLKSGVCEETIYAKRLVKKENIRKNDSSSSSSSTSLVSSDKIIRRAMGQSQHCCLPFLTEDNTKIGQKISRYSRDDKKKRRSTKQEKKKRSSSCILVGPQCVKKKKKAEVLKLKRKRSAASEKAIEVVYGCSKSELSNTEAYLEKYVVKLGNSDEKLVLYDVKPKFCEYLTTKGILRNIVEKLVQRN